MTTQKSKSKTIEAPKVQALNELPTIQHSVELATSIASNIGKGESIRKQINDTALSWFAPFQAAGADATYLKAYSEKKEKNNLKRTVRDHFVEACSVAVVGRSGLAFLEDKNNSPEAEFTATEGTLSINPKPRSKQYIQQQYGKIISAVGAAIKQAAKDAEDGVDSNALKEKTKKTDCERALEGIAKANTQANKSKPAGSIPEALSEAICWIYKNQKALQDGKLSFGKLIYNDYFEDEADETPLDVVVETTS